MPLGTRVNIEGPFGGLTLPEHEARLVVFLTGGIGITPFRSMLVHAVTHNSLHPLVLFYSNRRPEDAPFLQELQDLQRKIPDFTFVGTMTQLEKSNRPWKGERGYLDHKMLVRHLSGIKSPLYYIVGPPVMVEGFRTMLETAGVPRSEIRIEEFVGY